MYKIKFGTDGWRAIIAKDYTIDNLKRVSEATAKWMISRDMTTAIIGYDCRFAGEMFSETVARVFGHLGIKVMLSESFVSTPMVSLAVVKTGADMGIVITASHNPPSYNGFKLKSSYGGPTIPSEIAQVEAIIPETPMGTLKSFESLKSNSIISYMDLEKMYNDEVEKAFDLKAINNYVNLAYDAMYGAGQNVIRHFFPMAKLFHCEFNPSFHGRAPEPILRNLPEIAEFLSKNKSYNLGLANDGDADRVGLFDEDGEFVDSHHILLLLLYYMYKHKGMRGKVIVTFSVTNKMKKLAEYFDLEFEVTKIGFKYIAEIMQKEDILVGGEESGGLAVKGHIPERDGIWIGLVIMEFMAKTQKTLKELIQEIYDLVGSFSYYRDDLHLDETRKQAIIKHCEQGKLTHIGDLPVIQMEDLDGYKFHLPGDSWVMIRPSGTEPVLRVYAQAADATSVRSLLDETREQLQQI